MQFLGSCFDEITSACNLFYHTFSIISESVNVRFGRSGPPDV